MPTPRQTIDAAIDLYVQRATPEEHWQDRIRRGIDRALEELTDSERNRFLDYVDRFALEAALFPIKRIAEIYTLCWLENADDATRQSRQHMAQNRIIRFRADFVTPPPGQEEGRRAEDAPHPTFHAALRQRQGEDTPAAFREMTAATVNMVMDSFVESDRGQLDALFEQLPVGAVAGAMFTWTWGGGDEKLKPEIASRQFARWRQTNDASVWWQIRTAPREEAAVWIYF
jgi:hypothetical protein